MAVGRSWADYDGVAMAVILGFSRYSSNAHFSLCIARFCKSQEKRVILLPICVTLFPLSVRDKYYAESRFTPASGQTGDAAHPRQWRQPDAD
ncbi:hypothetical protein FGI04_17050 [Dickeya ananatis]|nr:hypothetical protein FGI04_17050 [Dickeya zeae]